MPTAPASNEVLTAALLVVGGKILSGRTKDQNIGYIAEYLTALGIDLKEVRVVSDEEKAIVDALTALRHRYSYVFTTGGIGPTHGDITADCVAKAFGVAIDSEGDIGMQLDEIAKANPAVAIGSSRFFDPQHGPNTNVVLRASDAQKPNAQSRHA